MNSYAKARVNMLTTSREKSALSSSPEDPSKKPTTSPATSTASVPNLPLVSPRGTAIKDVFMMWKTLANGTSSKQIEKLKAGSQSSSEASSVDSSPRKPELNDQIQAALMLDGRQDFFNKLLQKVADTNTRREPLTERSDRSSIEAMLQSIKLLCEKSQEALEMLEDNEEKLETELKQDVGELKSAIEKVEAALKTDVEQWKESLQQFICTYVDQSLELHFKRVEEHLHQNNHVLSEQVYQKVLQASFEQNCYLQTLEKQLEQLSAYVNVVLNQQQEASNNIEDIAKHILSDESPTVGQTTEVPLPPPSSFINRPICLEVEGVKYKTNVQTLTCQMAKSEDANNFFTKSLRQSPSAEVIEIDRDSTHFRYILNYMREQGKLENMELPADPQSLKELRREAQFYGLLHLASCIEAQLK